MRYPIAGLLLALSGVSAQADEGMWMPQQLPSVATKMQAAGLELDPQTMTQLTEFPMGAIISLGNCTASFISDKGLVVTNHHCAYDSIAHNSRPENDLLTNGFLAKTHAEELPAAPGSRIFITVDVRNVSAQVIDKKVSALTGKKRSDAIENKRKAMIANCEHDIGHRCNVYSYYGGLEFYLIKQMEVRDVRLVHAPAMGVGKFGGDTDNWMWPRHTGDYSFYRAYVGKDGKPADFHADNQPYQPKHWLKLAKQGVKEGDYVMVAGYPGRTNRHRFASEVEFTFGWSYPTFIQYSSEQLAIIARETNNRKDAELKYASTVASVNNYYKNRQGMLESYAKSNFLNEKKAQMAALKNWVQADKARQKQYGQDIVQAEKLIAERDVIARMEAILDYAKPRLLNTARGLYRLAQEKTKPDTQRKLGFQERDLPRYKQAMEALDRRYDEQVDKAVVAHFLQKYLTQVEADRIPAFEAALGLRANMSATEIGAQLDKLYGMSKLADKTIRLNWLQADVKAFQASDDAFIKAAVAMFADDLKRERRDDELGGNIQQAYAQYMKALIAYKNTLGEPVYPDANSTLRVTFGHVKNREIKDGNTWNAFTTLRGISAKHTGTGEFDAPDAQINAINARDFGAYYEKSLDSVPVNYLTTVDITGGNSGSPTLNSKGEFIGLAFDGTLDSVISDWYFAPQITRTIHADMRYMLWQMRQVDKADNLLKEMQAW